MIIGALVRHAAPFWPAGAEWSLQDTLVALARRGHDCRILALEGSTRERIGSVGPDAKAASVLVYSQPTPEERLLHWQECDVMLTQLDATMDAQLDAATYQTPLVHLIHSANQLEQLGVVPSCSALVVYNAAHVANACKWWPGHSITLRPVIDAARVKATKLGKAITLVNVSSNKGGAEFQRLARDLPDLPFYGVRGAYGDQVIDPDALSNLAVGPAVGDVARMVFDYTRILCVLSASETYGRIAAEAMVSGIPVVAHETPGLREACGTSAVYVDRAHPDELARTVNLLYRDHWQNWSERATARAAVLARRQARELRAFERALIAVHNRQPRMTL